MVALLCCMVSNVGVNADSAKKNKAAKWMKERAKKEGVYQLKSGLCFKILAKGTGRISPTKKDKVEIEYTETLKDGVTVIGTSSEAARNSPTLRKVDSNGKGVQEALQLMREGDKWELYIPYELAYGSLGNMGRIPGFAPVIYNVELTAVVGKGKPAKDNDKIFMEQLGKQYSEMGPKARGEL